MHGGAKLSRAAHKLRQAGREDLVRELGKGLRRGVRPLMRNVRAAAAEKMPSGYAPVLLKDLRLRTVVRTRAGMAGLLVRAHAPTRSDERDVANLDRGILAHNLFGDREHWYRQPIPAGFFTDPMRDGSPAIRPELEKAIDNVLDKIARG